MKCPSCNGDTHIIQSRKIGGDTRRRRECEECFHRWTTFEVSENMLTFYESQINKVQDLEKTIHELTKKQQGRSGKRTWTESEYQLLITLYNENLPFRKIAEKLGRTYSSIDKRINVFRKQGLL